MTSTEDLFTPIHKGLRSMVYNLSGRMQTNDFADLPPTEALLADLENDFAVARAAGCVLCILSNHAVDEDVSIFPEVARHGNGLVTQLIAEHQDLTRREVALALEGRALLALAAPADRVASGIVLNQHANELFAAYIVHMNREDTELVPLMRRHFTDAQMAAMRGKIMGGMPPDRLFAILGWMLPSLNVSELSGLMASLRNGAPPPLFQAVSSLCAEKVDPARWSEVKGRVGF
jgi:hypothetical protein